MRVYLAAPQGSRHCEEGLRDSPFILESFAHFQPWVAQYINDDFLLDSGAFTFLQKARNNVDWDAYVRRYAQFINEHGVKLFFELDIDGIVGLKEVERLRGLLERLTARRCIPVWHKSRGKQYFLDTVKRYDYVAIGGIVTKEIMPKEYKCFPWFINTAHEHGAKIHGLGFTRLRDYHLYPFDSVDSTTWLSGRRFGIVYQFKDGQLLAHKGHSGPPAGNYKSVDVHNLREWVKYQRYAELYL